MLSYSVKRFQELSLEELYAILRLRQEVFIVEQNCPYLDCDDKDQKSHHLLGKDNEGHLLAYCRILEKGISYENYSSIGRVVTSILIRGNGEGRALMKYAIKETLRLFPKEKIKISAQSYITPLYQSLGFVKVGEEYLEDDIPHIGMVYDL